MELQLPSNIPDPERARNNLDTFIDRHPDYYDRLKKDLYPIAILFSYSQFLASYCIKNPDSLFKSLDLLDKNMEIESLKEELHQLLKVCNSIKEGMGVIRNFKKEKLLPITIKDILKRITLQETIYELSILSEAILSESLNFIFPFLRNKYGDVERESLSVIALGKLGSYELNYSSDVDLIFTYKDSGYTSGILSPQGVVINRISNFEFYCKIIEEYCRFLSANTEDGFAYRVDLRLRPQGQKGSLILDLRDYEEYYESWGQLWERAALIRARAVAGDIETGEDFIRIIRPFIYRKYLDYDAIEEIRRLKFQVEQIKPGTYSKDIKRGFGGIREIEFFVQIFQLIYGGREPLLREGSTLIALHRLLQKAFIGHEEYQDISSSYIFLRTLEHRLQQLNDIQTHSIPSNERDLDILAKKMGFDTKVLFISALFSKRFKVRQIYDSLLEIKSSKSINTEKGIGMKIMESLFWEMDSPIESLITEEISKTKIKEPRRAIQYLTKIRNSIYSFQTLRGRRLLEDIIPKFINEALNGNNPDSALLQIVGFSNILASRESYLESLSNRQELISALTFIFSNSEYLSKILMNSPEYIDSMAVEGLSIKTREILKNELTLLIDKHGISTAIRLFRNIQEIRLGVLFLNNLIDVMELMASLSLTAEIILTLVLQSEALFGEAVPQSKLFIVGLGKLGGKEITFNSDIDIIFLCPDESTETDIKKAEKIIRIISSYTKDGIGYRIDMRLRPDGSKGTLVSSLEGIENYYLRYAHLWELQAFLKARAIGSNPKNHSDFLNLKRRIFQRRAEEIKKDDIKKMCQRLQKELSKETLNNNSYDIKYGIGGLAELEFFVQYMQLLKCKENSDLLLPNTYYAINMLHKRSFLDLNDAERLKEIYKFYRTIETLLRLRNDAILKEGSNALEGIVYFLKSNSASFIAKLRDSKSFVNNIWERY